MSNVIYLNSPNRGEDTQPPSDFAQQKLARTLQLKLNAPKDGDIAAILTPDSNKQDLECILTWLDENIYRLKLPLDIDQCYELLCTDLNDRLITR